MGKNSPAIAVNVENFLVVSHCLIKLLQENASIPYIPKIFSICLPLKWLHANDHLKEAYSGDSLEDTHLSIM